MINKIKTHQTTEFIGRKNYLSNFKNHLELLENKKRLVYNIYAPKGVGKTTLLDKFKETVEIKAYDIINIDLENVYTIDTFIDIIIRELHHRNIPAIYFELAYSIYFKKKNPNIKMQDKVPEWLEDFGDISELVELGGAITGPAKWLYKKFNNIKNKFQLEEKILTQIDKLQEKEVIKIEKELLTFLIQDLKRFNNQHGYDGVIFFLDNYHKIIETLVEDEVISLIEQTTHLKSLFIITTLKKIDEEFISFKEELYPFSKDESHLILSEKGITDTKNIKEIIELSDGIGSYLNLAIKIFQKREDENTEELLNKIHHTISKKRIKENIKILKNTEGTNKPNYIKTQYKKDIFRENQFSLINEFILHEETENSLSIIYGAPGIGKSSFMATASQKFSQKHFQTIIYFIEDALDDIQHLENIIDLIEENLKNTLQEQNIALNLNTEQLKVNRKLEYLLENYNKYIYKQFNTSLIIMVDALDTLVDEKAFIFNLISNYTGIHFIGSTRKNPSSNTYLKIKEQNKNLTLFKKNNENGLQLETLTKEQTLLYFDENHQLTQTFTDKEIEMIKDKIYQKSKGLPKYFELSINKLNQFSKKEKPTSYNQLIEYIDKIPKDLEDLYLAEFKQLEEISSLSLEILKTLYWYGEVSKSFLIDFLQQDLDKISSALKSISYLIYKENNHYRINHLSIKEALFTYYQYDKSNQLVALHLDEPLIKKLFTAEAPILKYLADNEEDLYKNFSSIYYFDSKNILFQTLENLIQFFITNKLLKSELLIIQLNFLKIIYIQNMISSEILLEKEKNITELFKEKKVSLYIQKYAVSVLSLYSHIKIENIYEVKQLLSIAILSQNHFYISRYVKEYHIFKYTNQFNHFFKKETLDVDRYIHLDSILSKTFISLYWTLSEKDLPSELSFYNDGGLALLYHNKKSKNEYINLLNTFKINRSFLEKIQRQYQTIKYSRNLKLKNFFYNNAYYYAKSNNTLTEKAKLFLNELNYDIVTQSLENFSISNKKYKYLPLEEKQRVDKLYKLFKEYKNEGLTVLLKKEYISYFIEISLFIKESDQLKFLSFCIESNHKNTLNIIGVLIRKTEDKEFLLFCKKYLLHSPIKNVTQTINLIIIYYKLEEIENLKNLKDKIATILFEREEQSLISKIANNVEENLFELYNELKTTSIPLSSLFNRYANPQNFNTEELTKYKHIIFNNEPENFSKLIVEASFLSKDLILLKQIFQFYKKHLNQKEIQYFILNILQLENFETFLKKIEMFPDKEQIDYLLKVPNVDAKKDEVPSDKLITFIFNLISKNTDSDIALKFLKKIYKRKAYRKFSVKNHEFVYNIYNNINGKKSKNDLYIKALFYQLSIVHKAENNYLEISEQQWIPDNIKSKIAMTMIFHMKNHDHAIKLSEVTIGFDRAKVLIHLGTLFDDNNYIQEGIKLLYDFRFEKVQNEQFFNNYLEYTLRHNLTLNENSIAFANSIFHSNTQNKTLLTTFLNIEKFSNSYDFTVNYIVNSNEFLKNYLNYIQSNNQIKFNDFNKNKTNILIILTTLYNQYKEAEVNEDEINYEKLETVFSKFKIEFSSFLNEHFNQIDSLNLDNIFLNFKYENSISVELLHSNYLEFYKKLNQLYNDYTSNNSEKRDEAIKKFNILKEQIISKEEHINILKERSNITSKLSLKLDNIHLFKAIDIEN